MWSFLGCLEDVIAESAACRRQRGLRRLDAIALALASLGPALAVARLWRQKGRLGLLKRECDLVRLIWIAYALTTATAK